MGQRLNIEIRNNEKPLANAYYHWSALKTERWEKNLEMLKSGALGDDTLPDTLLRYWKMQERAGYPNASENVKYFEDMVRKEMK